MPSLCNMRNHELKHETYLGETRSNAVRHVGTMQGSEMFRRVGTWARRRSIRLTCKVFAARCFYCRMTAASEHIESDVHLHHNVQRIPVLDAAAGSNAPQAHDSSCSVRHFTRYLSEASFVTLNTVDAHMIPAFAQTDCC